MTCNEPTKDQLTLQELSEVSGGSSGCPRGYEWVIPNPEDDELPPRYECRKTEAESRGWWE
ncbi:hypothetical protein EV12_1100 [Prochlorococcus sp. MIT 0701]|nr:hypothetical protein EV12_1100 [Prochlorococcus sp. MIT 0701]